MEASFFSSIPEFDFEISLEKMELNNQAFFTYQEAKRYLYYITGVKIKKKSLRASLNQMNSDTLSKADLYSLYTLFTKQITAHDMIITFYNYIKAQSSTVTLAQFLSQMNKLYPNINNNLLSQLFLHIDQGNSGELKLTDLEAALLSDSSSMQ